MFGRLVRTPPRTVLQLQRTNPTPGPGVGHIGYTLDEMTAIAEGVLPDIGMTTRFPTLGSASP